MTKSHSFVLSVFVLIAGWLLAPDPARACSYAVPPPAFRGYPQDGAVGVPTDVRPFYDSLQARFDPNPVEALGTATFDLTSAAGRTISFSTQRLGVNSELVFEAELDPMTVYTLRGRWRAPEATADTVYSVTFTTGSGPLATPPGPPQASMERYVYDYGGREISSCDPATIGSCVAVPADTAIWVTQVAESGQDDGGQLVTGPFFTNRSYPGELGPFVCARLRTRAPNGSLSEPVELCGRDATAYQLGGTLSTIACTPGGLAQDGLLLSAQLPPGDGKDTDAGSSGACALAGGPTGDSRVALLALGAVVIVAASRRRRRDTP